MARGVQDRVLRIWHQLSPSLTLGDGEGAAALPAASRPLLCPSSSIWSWEFGEFEPFKGIWH